MTDNHTKRGARNWPAARNMACRCGLIKEGICDTCISLRAYGAEVQGRIASGRVTGHSTDPMSFPKSYGAGLPMTRTAINRIKSASGAASRNTEPPSLEEALSSRSKGISARSKGDEEKK